MWSRWGGLALAAVMLGGCGITDGIFGGGEDESRLPGERVPVLTEDGAATPDPAIADREIEVPGARANSAWPQPGGRPDHRMGHLELSSGLEPAWTADLGTGNGYDRRILGQPVVAAGRVFALDARATVSAYAAGSGERVWRRKLTRDDGEASGSYFGGGVAYAQGRLYVTTGDGRVTALDAENGETVWQQGVGAPIHAAPTIHRDAVLVNTEANRTIALAAGDGTQQWSHQGIQERAGFVGSASPAARDSTSIVGYSSGQLFALLTSNGRSLWSDTLASLAGTTDPVADMADIRGMPVIGEDRVYASSNANRTVAINLRRGDRAWSRDIGSINMPWVAGNAVYVLSPRARVAALFRDSGKMRWLTKIPRYTDPDDQEGRIIWYGPVLARGQLLMAGSNETLLALDPASGDLDGTTELAGKPAVPPVVARNTLYIITRDAQLIALQ
ncbi:Outer membrane protein assembly factor BamB, contains PQQ-like beta-propeller repeat [Limimonas halophila]|uniref:Outer membrane protein assembly factor BamB, contains PQQ-like beta-propeller repeat n=1 Tax=Limimonas halophila TaxID=1082479 RepID=A0A1G7MCV3_9PROT|nr:PQQ-binding-like beta-propeller repeat protein [Limimonas halophila]SDF59612.1 Outer membrane protein assembly factor BamB, contains PQQ-like beta-propeller repeat [Limimonas halophila]